MKKKPAIIIAVVVCVCLIGVIVLLVVNNNANSKKSSETTTTETVETETTTQKDKKETETTEQKKTETTTETNQETTAVKDVIDIGSDDVETQLMLRNAAVFGFSESTYYIGWSEPESAYTYMTFDNGVVTDVEIDDSSVNYETAGTYPVTYIVTISRDKWIENRDVIISTCADPVKSQGYDYVYDTALDDMVNENSPENVTLRASSTVVVVDKMPWE